MNKQIRKKNQIRLGIFLMLFSGVFFGASFIIPLLGFETKTKVIAITTSLILMEVVFWSGGLLVGKELFQSYKKNLNPKNWFNKKENDEKQDNTI